MASVGRNASQGRTSVVGTPSARKKVGQYSRRVALDYSAGVASDGEDELSPMTPADLRIWDSDTPPYLNRGSIRQRPSRRSVEQRFSLVASEAVSVGSSPPPVSRSGSRNIGRPMSGSVDDLDKLLGEWKENQRCFRRLSRGIAESGRFWTFTIVLTVYTLFSDDVKLIGTSVDKDWIFDVCAIICMVIFTVEIVACSFGRVGYRFSFHFWKDIVATVTLIADITAVQELTMGDFISNLYKDDAAYDASRLEDAAASGSNNRAHMISRMGVSAGRVVRLTRILRLLRMWRLCRRNSNSILAFRLGFDMETDEDVGTSKDQEESALSQKLQEMTMRRVVMLVLVIFFALQFLDSRFFSEKLPDSALYGANVLQNMWCKGMKAYQPEMSASNLTRYMNSTDRRTFEDDFRFYIYFHNPLCADSVNSDRDSPSSVFARLFFISLFPRMTPGSTLFLPALVDGQEDWDKQWSSSSMCSFPMASRQLVAWNRTTTCVRGRLQGVSIQPALTCPEELRIQERVVIIPTTHDPNECYGGALLMVFDRRLGSRYEAFMNSLQTLFICILLAVANATFATDVNKLVLGPIESMVSKLERIWHNPLEAIQLSSGEKDVEHEVLVAEMEAIEAAEVGGRRRCWRQLINWLVNEKKANSADTMETVVLEKTIIKIGSFLAIGFGDAGAAILAHNLEVSDSGNFCAVAPGEEIEVVVAICSIRRFLEAADMLAEMVMPFVNRIAELVHNTAFAYYGYPLRNLGDSFVIFWKLPPEDQEAWKRRRMADLALVAMAKVLASIVANTGLVEGPINRRIVAFRVRLSCGMHAGHAIAGAVGSEFKVVASLLGKVVQNAGDIDNITAEYGSMLLLSDVAHSLLSEDIAEQCRLIDNVVLPNAARPTLIHTLDLDDTQLDKNVRVSDRASPNPKQQLKDKADKQLRFAPEHNVSEVFGEGGDMAILLMRDPFTKDFCARFHMGYLNYIAGQWKQAKHIFEETRALLLLSDGAANALLRYMQQFEFSAPPWWTGCRPSPHPRPFERARDWDREGKPSVPYGSPSGARAQLLI